jgi:hypothetical protein
MKSPGQKQVNENEGISEETIEKTTYTFEKKTVHHQHTPPSMSRTIEVIKRIEEKTMSPEEEK